MKDSTTKIPVNDDDVQVTTGKIKKIDFTNMDELRRSIIVSEILNRKY